MELTESGFTHTVELDVGRTYRFRYLLNCAYLHRGGGVNKALVSVALGARSVEAQTHLPSTVTMFNT